MHHLTFNLLHVATFIDCCVFIRKPDSIYHDLHHCLL